MHQAARAQPRPQPADVDRQRVLDVLTMHRLSHRPEGTAAVIRWLAGRTGCWAGLLEPSGAVLVESMPVLDPPGRALLVGGLEEMRERGLPAFVASEGSGRRAVLLAVELESRGPGPVFAMVGPEGVPVSLPADATVVLATCWSAERARQLHEQVELAEVRCREAVLHLLMSRHVATARQLASTLFPSLPDPMRVHLIECSPAVRGEVAHRCTELSGGTAWTVRCPVRSRHLIVLAPASLDSSPHAEGDRRRWEIALAESDDCLVGTGDVVALGDAAVGYEQAFHALAVARGTARRWARFDAALDLASVAGAPGLAWADSLLAPLVSHRPARSGDPDAHELMATARSWLSFSTAATRHLKIHRNTLAGRLRRLEELLGLDLSRAGQQAALNLAIRIRSAPGPADSAAAHPERPGDLDDLLRLPVVRRWAQAVLRPVRDSPQASALESTLRVWLEHDSRLSGTAEAMGLSVAGARKRVVRLEAVLRRSLLHAPSARHDLWLAVRAVDLDPAPDG